MMYGRGYGYGYGSMMNGGWFVGLLMLMLFLAVVAAVVLVVVWMVRNQSGHGHGATSVPPSGGSATSSQAGHDEAVAIAKRRLASGEISTEEYAEIMRHLGG